MSMAPSATAISISQLLWSNAARRFTRDPRRQTRADRRSAKDVLARIQEIVCEYCSPFLAAISSASRLWYLMHSFPIPPVIIIIIIIIIIIMMMMMMMMMMMITIIITLFESQIDWFLCWLIWFPCCLTDLISNFLKGSMPHPLLSWCKSLM